MTVASPPTAAPALAVRVLHGRALAARLPHLRAYALRAGPAPLSRDPAWLGVLEDAFRHEAYALEAVEGAETRGLLPLAFVRSLLFGRFLVSLPYLNSNGALADDDATRRRLVDRAVALADELRVRHLELRHETPVEHPATGRREDKVHMRLPLPDFPGPLWEGLPPKVRNQVRKAEKGGLTVAWGGPERLGDFYAVFSRNMRDLGTPVYGRGLFRAVLERFPGAAELCVVRAGRAPAAAALLLHGPGVTEVPSASSLRRFNPTCANMLLYWSLRGAPSGGGRPSSTSAAPPGTATPTASRSSGARRPRPRSGSTTRAPAGPPTSAPTTPATNAWFASGNACRCR
jgi:FemAB-related protein (PEP-CTERM system-associated)